LAKVVWLQDYARRGAAASAGARPMRLDNGEAASTINPRALADLEELGSSPAFMDKLIGMFVADSLAFATKMENALGGSNLAEFRSYLHAMKGSAASMGAERLTCYCRDVGRLADAEIKLQGPPLLKSLREELASTRDALHRYLQGRRKSAG